MLSALSLVFTTLEIENATQFSGHYDDDDNNDDYNNDDDNNDDYNGAFVEH